MSIELVFIWRKDPNFLKTERNVEIGNDDEKRQLGYDGVEGRLESPLTSDGQSGHENEDES